MPEAFATLGPELSFEHKLDGARVQIHHAGDESGGVRIFSRRLNEITESIPDVVEVVNRIGARHAILDGEVIGVDASGRPAAFQDLMRRFGRTRDVDKARAEQPLKLYVFDVLALDGELTIDRPWADRISMLEELRGRQPGSKSSNASSSRTSPRPRNFTPTRSPPATKA